MMNRCNIQIIDTDGSVEGAENGTNSVNKDDAMGLVLSPHYRKKK
jgi:hypothetical protein